jgi:hypothetical protein
MNSTPAVPPLTARNQMVIPALVGVLVVVILSILGDVAITAAATTAVGVQFRFQVVGLFFAGMPNAALVLAAVAGVATLSGHRVALRGSSFAALVIGVVVLILIPFFGLDLLETRRAVPRSNLAGFTLAAIKTGGFAGWLALMLLWAGWRGIQASRKAPESELRTKGQGLVVGQE